MRIPLNPIAETIQQLEEDNYRYNKSIVEFQENIAKNEATILQIESLAEWEEIVEAPPLEENTLPL